MWTTPVHETPSSLMFEIGALRLPLMWWSQRLYFTHNCDIMFKVNTLNAPTMGWVILTKSYNYIRDPFNSLLGIS